MATIHQFPKRGLGTTPSPTLQKGSTGTAVRDIQLRLIQLGYGLDTDGIFGDNTWAAVKHFQRSVQLTDTGIVDATTFAKLDAAAKAKGFVEPSLIADEYGPPGPAPATKKAAQQLSPPPLVNAGGENATTPFFQTDFGKKSLVVLGGIAGVALLAYIVKGDGQKLPRAAMNGYSRFITDVSSNVRGSERKHGPSKVGTRTSTRKACSRTPASKMLVDAEVLSAE